MGFKMPPIPTLVGIVCAGVGLLFQIVGVATPGWIVVGTSSQGLWKYCYNDACNTFSGDLPDWWEACRAFGILGVLVLVGCLVVGILICFMEFDKLPIIAAILAFVAAFCILVEFAVYAGERGSDDFGYSFALTIVAWILAIVAGVCFIVGKGNA
ncbi:lens fiber membrane intrinsic protein-like [Littorina saxatilis]|uniref:Uncharacterized protein n=1 Tax=Littorina saxatilis TaxID=31220 RepID=A0AAN9G1S2_9CAEN